MNFDPVSKKSIFFSDKSNQKWGQGLWLYGLDDFKLFNIEIMLVANT